MKMTLTITNLRVDFRKSESPKPWPDVPYLIVNCVFRCARTNDYGTDFAWHQAKAYSEEYRQILTLDDPERFDAWLMDPDGWNLSSKYDGYGRAWTHEDPAWKYIEKFDCFWFRSWSADCTVTRAIIAELEYYRKHGKLPSVYRSVDEGIILSHLRTLGETYWD
jgi:hypothetical protein